MRIAIVGAGVAGLASAWELGAAGHEVTVYDRLHGVAEGASFGHANLLAAGLVSPAAAPGLRPWLLRGLRHHEAALRWRPRQSLAAYRWLWRWWRASRAGHQDQVRAMTELAMLSLRELEALRLRHGLQIESAPGVLVLLRDERELAPAHRHAQMLRELGWPVQELSPEACRGIEPHLAERRLAGGLHLSDDGVGNGRLWVQRLRELGQQHFGLQLRLGTEVQAAQHEGGVLRLQLRHHRRSAAPLRTPGGPAAGGAGRPSDFDPTEPLTDESVAEHDALVLCGGADPVLLRRLGLRLPLLPVWGHSLTLRLRADAWALNSAVVDARAGVTLTRLGERLRVTGGFELDGCGAMGDEAALAPLYATLDRWFPHATERRQPQVWRGARPMLPEGPPLIGAAGPAGVWLNLGHGAHGWTLACGAARLLAEQIDGRAPSLPIEPFAPARWLTR